MRTDFSTAIPPSLHMIILYENGFWRPMHHPIVNARCTVRLRSRDRVRPFTLLLIVLVHAHVIAWEQSVQNFLDCEVFQDSLRK